MFSGVAHRRLPICICLRAQRFIARHKMRVLIAARQNANQLLRREFGTHTRAFASIAAMCANIAESDKSAL